MNELEKFLLDNNRLQEIAQDILAAAKKAGADQAEVSVAAHKGFSVSALDGDVETIEYNQDKAIEVHVYFGKRTGTAATNDIRKKAIQDTVEAACHIAKFTDEDPSAGLADRDELAFQYPEINLAYSWPISVEKAIELACLCERTAVNYDKRIIRAEEVTVATADVLQVLANSLGFVGAFPYTRHEISCVLVAKENDEMQRDYSYTIAADPQELRSPTEVANEAAERTIARLGARRINTTRAPVLFIAEEARGLLGTFTSAISGRSIYRKASFLHDALGQKVFPDFIHMQEFPHLNRALGSAPFDNDGVATRSNVFIDKGVLQSYLLGVYSARKLGMKTTGNAGGVHNLTIKTGNKDFKALVKAMHRGLIVTEMMGQGANLVTGDYSRGASGFWVENGEIQFPVHEVTVAGNLKDMYQRIAEVGNDVDDRGSIHTGSILIDDIMIAGE